MKRLTIILTILIANTTMFAQTVNRVFEKDNNIFVMYSDGNTKQLTSLKQDYNPATPKDNSFVIFLRTPSGELSEDDFLSGKKIETKIVKIDLKTLKETTIVQGCKNDSDKADISYGGSDIYPFETLCSIQFPSLTPDGKRVYFTTEAWATSTAIHYYSFESGKIFFYSSGDFLGLDYQGNVKVTLTGISKGRYTQDWLLDGDGNKIKPLSKPEY